MPNSAYWDSCIFIIALQKGGPRCDACMELLAQAKAGSLVIVTSTWTITEVNRLDELGKSDGLSREKQSQKILDFFENPYIKLRQLDRDTACLAHHLTRTHNLTNADAIHLATALSVNVEVFYTYDSKKGKRRGLLKHSLKVGGNPPLRIEMPPVPNAGPLFIPLKPGECPPPP